MRSIALRLLVLLTGLLMSAVSCGGQPPVNPGTGPGPTPDAATSDDRVSPTPDAVPPTDASVTDAPPPDTGPVYVNDPSGNLPTDMNVANVRRVSAECRANIGYAPPLGPSEWAISSDSGARESWMSAIQRQDDHRMYDVDFWCFDTGRAWVAIQFQFPDAHWENMLWQDGSGMYDRGYNLGRLNSDCTDVTVEYYRAGVDVRRGGMPYRHDTGTRLGP